MHNYFQALESGHWNAKSFQQITPLAASLVYESQTKPMQVNSALPYKKPALTKYDSSSRSALFGPVDIVGLPRLCSHNKSAHLEN